MTTAARLQAGLLGLLFAAAVHGQEVLEEMTVTGSRIILSGADTPFPVSLYDASRLADSGIVTLGEFSRRLPLNEERDVYSIFAEFLLPLHGRLDLQAAFPQ